MIRLTILIILTSLQLMITTALITYGLYRQYRFFVIANESMLGSRFDPRETLSEVYHDRLQAMVFGMNISPADSEVEHVRLREFNVVIPVDRFEIVPNSIVERVRSHDVITSDSETAMTAVRVEVEEEPKQSSDPIAL